MPSRECRMPLVQLRRDTVLRDANYRSLDDRKVVLCRPNNVPPAETDRSRSPRRPVDPTSISRQPPIPQSPEMFRPPPTTLWAVPDQRPTRTVQPVTNTAQQTSTNDNRISEPSASPAPTIATTVTAKEAAPLNTRQRQNQSRVREWRNSRRAAYKPKSQQFRLENPAPSTTPPVPGAQLQEETTPSVAEATVWEVKIPTGTGRTSEQLSTASTTPEDMEESELDEPEDNSQSNNNNPVQRTHAKSPLQQLARLLERSQQLLCSATAETSPPETMASRECRMPLVQLRRDTVLWVVNYRGLDDHTA
ncbi:mucin-2-like, partial [Aphis craccivora]